MTVASDYNQDDTRDTREGEALGHTSEKCTLVPYIDGELDQDTAHYVEDHIYNCPTCRKEYEDRLASKQAYDAKTKKEVAGKRELISQESSTSTLGCIGVIFLFLFLIILMMASSNSLFDAHYMY